MKRYTARHIRGQWFVWDRLKDRPVSGPHKDQYTATRHAAPLNTAKAQYEFLRSVYGK